METIDIVRTEVRDATLISLALFLTEPYPVRHLSVQLIDKQHYPEEYTPTIICIFLYNSENNSILFLLGQVGSVISVLFLRQSKKPQILLAHF